MKQIENVIVDNGIEQYKVQYHYSDRNMVSMVNTVMSFVPDDIIDEINDKNFTVLIKTTEDFEYISKTILGASNDLIFRFNGII